ncbi:MAG: DinB family protein [Anaerolineales bacterium]|nr:DinB family protein [Anaerolineales bacterium]
MPTTPTQLAQRLSENADKSLEFFRSLTPEQWEKAIFSDIARWNARQVLAHFASAEMGRATLIQDILSGGAGSPENFSVDAFNEQEVNRLDHLSVDELIQQFASLRQETARLVASLAQEDLVRPGRDPFLGQTTLEEIIQLTYRHTQIHLREMRKAIEPGR